MVHVLFAALFTHTCKNCEEVLEYNDEDIKVIETMDITVKYIVCPSCNRGTPINSS